MMSTQLLVWLAFVVSVSALENSRKPLKVFIMAGQSNMQGHGYVDTKDVSGNYKNGTLQWLVTDPRTKDAFARVRESSGNWVVRNDVVVSTTDQNSRTGFLTVGFGERSNKIGPELGFGMQLADLLGEPILLIKTVWGGKSLAGDYRPPSAISSRGNPQNKPLVTLPDGRECGVYFKLAVDTLREKLENVQDLVPSNWLTNGYELAAFEWHQGWNDAVDFDHDLSDPKNAAHEYEKNLVDFIGDMRNALKGLGAQEDLPFVVGASGFAGRPGTALRCQFGADVCTGLHMMWSGQMAVGDSSKHPELKQVVSVDSVPFLREEQFSPDVQGYHWWNNAETYFLLGNAMASATAAVLANPSTTKATTIEPPATSVEATTLEASTTTETPAPVCWQIRDVGRGQLLDARGRYYDSWNTNGFRSAEKIRALLAFFAESSSQEVRDNVVGVQLHEGWTAHVRVSNGFDLKRFVPDLHGVSGADAKEQQWHHGHWTGGSASGPASGADGNSKWHSWSLDWSACGRRLASMILV